MADTITTLHSSTYTDDDGDVEDGDKDRTMSIYDTKIKHLAYGDDGDDKEEEDSDFLGEENEDGDDNIMTHMSRLSVENSWDLYDSDRESGCVREGERRREQWLEKLWEMRRKRKEGGGEDHLEMDDESGESECVLIAKPEGGEQPMSMDMVEMKACEHLGFQLQPEWTLELPRGLSFSSIDTDCSDRNSPLANFRISSPG